MDITSEHINHFSTNGAILLKGAFSEFVEDVQNAIEENIKIQVGEKEHIIQMTVAGFFSGLCRVEQI